MRDCTHAPRVVGVFRNCFSVFVYDCDYITLKILEEIIWYIVVDDSANTVFVIVHRDESVAAPRLFQDFSPVKGVMMHYSIYSLTRSDAVGIVGVLGIIKGLELSALFPSQRMTEIACRVALCVVGDRLTIARDEQILPCAVVGVSLAVL